MLKYFDSLDMYKSRMYGWGLIWFLSLALNLEGAVLWRDPGPRIARDNGDGFDLLKGALKPHDNTSSSALYFKFTVDPLADVSVKKIGPFVAGIIFYERGMEHLGIGNGAIAHAYSAFNTSEWGLLGSYQNVSSNREYDLNCEFKGNKVGGVIDYPRRGVLRTILFRVQFVPGGDDQITVWFNPVLVPGSTEYSQLPGQVTRFKADASFDELHICHRGGGDGWKFTDLAIATTFDDFVAPYFWRQGWVIISAVLILLCIVVGVAWLVVRRREWQQMQQLARERALDRERTRIAQDLHDDVGAGLTEIMLMCESLERAVELQPGLCQRVSQVLFRVRRLVESMDQVVWTVNPENDTVSNFISYLSSFTQGFLESSSIRCRLDVPLGLPELVLTSPVRNSMFLAIKEALNNAVKYSGASDVWLRVKYLADELCVEVEDNGKGFDPSLVEGSGNGLQNLRKRSEYVGGRMELNSIIGKGTVVRFVFSLKNTK